MHTSGFLILSYCLFLGIFNIQGQNIYPVINDTKSVVLPTGSSLKAYGLPLEDIELLDSPFKQAMHLEADYLLSIEPDRLLHRFHLNAGLSPKGEIYGGWENETLSGHTLGHYLSACAMIYASSKDIRFKNIVDYIVSELKKCQDARKTGYIGAIPKEDSIWHEVSKGNITAKLFSLNGTWSPWYVSHKLMAGLLDAYWYSGNLTAKEINTRFADWVGELTSHLDEDQIQKMLICEFGGMNESLVNTYAVTGNKKYLELSYRFQHKAIIDSLALRYDVLTHKHSNTQIPKLLGSIRRYELTADSSDRIASEFFYSTVVQNHTYATGGNSDGEYFGEGKKMNDRLTDHTTETCNTYNMLKLNRHLFCLNPTSKLGDFYERALYNHILASQNPKSGMVCYFTPLRSGGKKEYCSPFHSFWCCTGTGMENHVKYGESIFYEGVDKNSLFINVFIPSKLNWKTKNVSIQMNTKFPYENKISISFIGSNNKNFVLKVRKPSWVDSDMTFSIKGQPTTAVLNDQGFYILQKNWTDDDTLIMEIPQKIYTESMIDNPNKKVFKYGPLVLAAKLDDRLEDPIYGLPRFVTEHKTIENWIKPLNKDHLSYITTASQPSNLILTPFYTLHDVRYAVYWDFYTPQKHLSYLKMVKKEKQRAQNIEIASIDKIDFGSTKSLDEHHFIGENLEPDQSFDRKNQSATRDGWLQFNMFTGKYRNLFLVLKHSGSEENRFHEIYVEGYKIASQWLQRPKPNRFIEYFYPLPTRLVTGKTNITIRLVANPDKKTPPVYDAYITRSKF